MRLLPTLIAAASLLALAPAAAAVQPAAEPELSEQEMIAQLQRAVASMREELFRPGERVEGWDRGGSDPDAELLAAGADRHYYLISSEDGPSVVILTARRISDFAPSSWRAVDSYGSAVDAVDRPFVQFSRLSPHYVVATRSNSFRRGGADCTDRTAHAMLYELPGDAVSEQDEAAPIMFRLGLLALEGQTVCTRYDGDRAAGWTMRAFRPDGAPLPALERPGERLTIVPASSIEALMAQPAAGAASGQS
jgi:hypothetical protein